jgi:hypothetical protein
VCARVGNQWSRGVVTARIRTDTVRSLRHQHQDLHQSTYHVPLERSGLILLSCQPQSFSRVQQYPPLKSSTVTLCSIHLTHQPYSSLVALIRCDLVIKFIFTLSKPTNDLKPTQNPTVTDVSKTFHLQVLP